MNKSDQRGTSASDTKLNPLLAALVRVLLCPKVIYLDPSSKDKILARPSILVSNHTGHLDGPVLNTALYKYKLHSLAAKDRFEQRGFGFFLRHTGCIPIDRQHADTSWIHESLKVLNVDKEHVVIYPEGRHGEHRRQLPFHSGVMMLTALARVPVVMVYIDGPVKFFRRNKLIIAPPFCLTPPDGAISADYVEEQTVLLQQKMTGLMQAFIKMND